MSTMQTLVVSQSVILGLKWVGMDLGEYPALLLGACCTASFFAVAAIYLMRNRIIEENLESDITILSPQMGTTAKNYEVMSTIDYDLSQLQALFSKTVLSVVVATSFYAVKGYTIPLVLQSVMIPLSIAGSELFRIHLQGTSASGSLSRPFSSANNWMTEMNSRMEKMR